MTNHQTTSREKKWIEAGGRQTKWVEDNRTIGCLILVDKPFYETMDYVLEPLKFIIPTNIWWRAGESAILHSHASLGGNMQIMRSINKEIGDMVAVRIEFDKDDVVQLSEATESSIEKLFMPYFQAAKTIPGVLAVGIGFNLSFPSDLQESSLQEAGVAVLFARDDEHKSWSRQQTMPLVGHF